MKPYTALQLEGRDLYIREGCVGCHCRWCARSAPKPSATATTRRRRKRLRPSVPVGLQAYRSDLARVGGRYSDDWHRAHLYNPRNVVPESKMPSYPWLVEKTLDGKDTAKKMSALRTSACPTPTKTSPAPRLRQGQDRNGRDGGLPAGTRHGSDQQALIQIG